MTEEKDTAVTGIDFNVNWDVLVKLTPEGIEELKRQHRALRAKVPNVGEFKPPIVDEDGYSKFQLWSLMEQLSSKIRLSGPNMFETELRLLPEPRHQNVTQSYQSPMNRFKAELLQAVERFEADTGSRVHDVEIEAEMMRADGKILSRTIKADIR